MAVGLSAWLGGQWSSLSGWVVGGALCLWLSHALTTFSSCWCCLAAFHNLPFLSTHSLQMLAGLRGLRGVFGWEALQREVARGLSDIDPGVQQAALKCLKASGVQSMQE
jgi:hypothetical protein